MRYYRWVVMVVVVAVALGACRQKDHQSAQQKPAVLTVKSRAIPLTLAFDTTVAPIRSQTIASRFDGVITHVDFHFGDVLQKGQVLLGIESNQLASDYREHITQYLQSKNTYTVAQAKFRGTEQLYQHNIVDRESYESEKNTLQTDLLGYMNQEQSLRDFLQILPASDRFDLQQLTLQNTDKVKAILQRPVATTELVAPMGGVALLADKDKDGSGIAIGASIKKNTNLLLVGDLSGLLLHFKVPEDQIRSIKIGDKVEVTCQALPSVKIQGQVQQISAQATLDGNQSVFPATVVVSSLPRDMISKVRVGMTAQIMMHIVQPKAIYIPIKAVAIRQGHKQVAVLEHGKQHWVDVGTAATSDDLVEISGGLVAGQKVLVPS